MTKSSVGWLIANIVAFSIWFIGDGDLWWLAWPLALTWWMIWCEDRERRKLSIQIGDVVRDIDAPSRNLGRVVAISLPDHRGKRRATTEGCGMFGYQTTLEFLEHVPGGPW